MKILILEDDPALRFALAQLAETNGHTAYPTGNIPEASEILLRVRPDLLLLDLMIGATTSIQIADLAGYCTPKSEVIYFTGSKKFPGAELFGLSKNASWVLRKPIDFVELEEMLGHIEKTAKVNVETSASTLFPYTSSETFLAQEIA